MRVRLAISLSTAMALAHERSILLVDVYVFQNGNVLKIIRYSEDKQVYCRYCGEKLLYKAKYCHNCGAVAPHRKKKSRIAGVSGRKETDHNITIVRSRSQITNTEREGTDE